MSASAQIMDPVSLELQSIETSLRQLPQEVDALVARSRRAIAEVQTEQAQAEARELYLTLKNISDALGAYLYICEFQRISL